MSNLDFVNFHQFLFKIFISVFSNLNLKGVGKLTSPLPANANVLSATSYSPPPILTFACYQQAGSDWKGIGVSGKWVR